MFLDDWLDEIDFAILYDVIEHYNKMYGLNATDAVRFYKKFRNRQLVVEELY